MTPEEEQQEVGQEVIDCEHTELECKSTDDKESYHTKIEQVVKYIGYYPIPTMRLDMRDKCTIHAHLEAIHSHNFPHFAFFFICNIGYENREQE